jgi:SPFH domain / Band 7 family
VQAHTRAHVITMSLEQALTGVKDLAAQVLAKVSDERLLDALGVVVEGLHFTSVVATPEMRKALEANHRESLQQRADQAIYARRANAVEEERRIKQRELDTEVELENQRKALVDTQARNRVTLAEADAKAEELKLAPYGELAPQVLAGMALKEWAAAGGQIGNLTVTPDMLGQIVAWIAGARK